MASVKISQGILKGGKAKTENGFDYYEFMGVPYAKPPVGHLRFKSPQAPEPWDGERDATKCNQNYISCQTDIVSPGATTVGSEDCLYLNVYTPKLPKLDSDHLPVLVYIHGGGFIVGSGLIKSELGPDYFIEQNIVVVTIHYRLGVLGFLSLDMPEAAGNMGLKDQVMALKWIRDNIEYFGGDKNKVTIMGLSAGAASVEYLILSPTTQGLFHKAIMQSGSTLNHWAINLHTLEFARDLVRILDYKGSLDDNRAIYEFLLKTPVSNLVQAGAQASAKYATKRICCGFVPTVEKDYGNGEAFLTSFPYRLLKEGKFNRVPVLRGFCNREGALTTFMGPIAKKNFVETKEFIGPYAFGIEFPEKEKYNFKCSSVYIAGQGDDNIDKISEDFFGDLDFISGIWTAGKYLSKYVPVYMYRFEHGGKINGTKRLFSFAVDEPGAIHGDDLTYTFKNDAIAGADEIDLIVRNRIVTMFTNFINFSDPAPATSDLIPIKWTPFTEDSKLFLSINKELHLKSDYEPTKMAIFEEQYEKCYGN